MKISFISPWKYNPKANKNSITGGVSLTVPNQSLSVREIMLRFTRGTPPHVRDGGYNDDFIPDVDSMDLAEREAFVKEHAAAIEKLRSLEEKREAQAAKARGAFSDSEHEEPHRDERRSVAEKARNKGDQRTDEGPTQGDRD